MSERLGSDRADSSVPCETKYYILNVLIISYHRDISCIMNAFISVAVNKADFMLVYGSHLSSTVITSGDPPWPNRQHSYGQFRTSSGGRQAHAKINAVVGSEHVPTLVVALWLGWRTAFAQRAISGSEEYLSSNRFMPELVLTLP